MQEGIPSKTAYRVALRRAAHQVFDDPVIFHDPLALRILGLSPQRLEATDLRAPNRPHSRSLRAFLVTRSRLAEDTLAAAVDRGVAQYVLLGAGLDTFAYRSPFPDLRVFEVDHPATQHWKRSLLYGNEIRIPETCTHVPVDFERESLPERLQASGFQVNAPTVFGWLGVVPYLTDEAFTATLGMLAEQPEGSSVILDYGLPRWSLPHEEQLAFDSLASRVAGAGEPFQLFFDPGQIQDRLLAAGYVTVEDLDSAAMNDRYLADRNDGLKILGSAAHLLTAVRQRHPVG